MHILKYIQNGVNLLFPAICPVCETYPADYPLPICRNCNDSLMAGCFRMTTSASYLRRIWSCCFYTGVAKKCIKKFKYGGKRQMIRVFDRMILRSLSGNFLVRNMIDLVIPVPVHQNRRRARGYNQSELIADIISGISSLPVCSDNLTKTKNTAPQTSLSGKQRITNLANSFSTLKPSFLEKKSILLVDDVITTGATLDTCARELLRAGARSVTGFTLAKAL